MHVQPALIDAADCPCLQSRCATTILPNAGDPESAIRPVESPTARRACRGRNAILAGVNNPKTPGSVQVIRYDSNNLENMALLCEQQVHEIGCSRLQLQYDQNMLYSAPHDCSFAQLKVSGIKKDYIPNIQQSNEQSCDAE